MKHLSAAYCAGRPELGWTDPNPPNAVDLMQACWDHCPVLDACAEWAASERDFEGVAGGQWWRNGRPSRWPRPRSGGRPAKFAIEDYDWLRSYGYPDEVIAQRLGVDLATLRKRLDRRRAERLRSAA